MQSHSRRCAGVVLAVALGACSQSNSPKAVVAVKPAVPKAIVLAPQPDPDAVVQSATVEPSPIFDEQYHGPDQGSLESVTALFARGYIESAMRETMLAAVHIDYPLLGMRDVRLTDPVSKFLTSPQARKTAHDYLYAGLARRLDRPLSPTQWAQIWQQLPQQGRLSDWVKQIKRVVAAR
ncbi:hypothetical protein CUC53_08145 [Aeromonas cavernicola]|uniref:Uncharacterized protein n=1 Tax=Aeromonas cavernicola TaxID=1006623 RepID=A0A2H9U5G4_9GAMM|nr:hypothetical protein CUC53_08145 [Aeromonas cavernicola]